MARRERRKKLARSEGAAPSRFLGQGCRTHRNSPKGLCEKCVWETRDSLTSAAFARSLHAVALLTLISYLDAHTLLV